MSLETETEVQELRTVQDEQGNSVPPATESEQQKTNDRLGNRDTLSGFTYSTNTTNEEMLTSNTIPEGVTVLVHPLPGNADTVMIGPAGVATYPLASGADVYTVDVRDTDQIAVEAVNAGDGVAVHYEEDN